MNKTFDALETCLQELENGADVETVLTRFPDLASELRPILKVSMKARARGVSTPGPSPEVVRRGRASLMQRAAEMRESRVAAQPRKRVIPAFQRLSLSFTLAALLLLSGTGLLNASASALPGESLYPVKRTWERLRLLLIFNEEAQNLLEDQIEYERLNEVNKLLVEGRGETIQFSGVFVQVNGNTYISGIPVILPSDMQLPANGVAVTLTGQTNAQGLVEIISIELLPEGSVVPLGGPVIVESTPDSGDGPKADSTPESDNEAPETESLYYEMDGTLQSISTTTLVINGLTVYLDNTRVEGELCPGIAVEVKGYFDEEGRFIVTKVKGEGSCSAENGGSENTDANSNNDDQSNLNDNEDDNTDSNDNNDNTDSNDNSDNNDNNDNMNEDNGNDNNDNGDD